MALVWNDQIVAQATAGVERGLGDAMEFLLQQSNLTVPLEEGTLERSGHTTSAGTHGEVIYNTPYAVIQHERLDFVHKGKGQAKWLENTCNRQGPQAASIVASAVRRAIGS